MIKTVIDANDGFMIEQNAGKTFLGDEVPALEVSVSELHSVSICDKNGPYTSFTLVSPLRLANGTLRSKVDDSEPDFHPDAHTLIRFIGTPANDDKYHQFDCDGNYLG